MKSTDQFKATIQQYLTKRAAGDPLFAESFKRAGKNIDDCCTYILNQVKKSGCNGFTDAEVFGMAVHYYDEEKIDVGKTVNCDVVVNHHVEKSKESKPSKAKRKPVKVGNNAPIIQPTLFD